MRRTAEAGSGKKVFCVGFQKTGTSTIARALQLLGYSVTGPNFIRDFEDRDDLLKKSTQLSERHDAFQDNPWPIFFREMDDLYPAASFILTRRDSGGWFRSMEKQFAGTTTPIRELIYGYGCPVGREETFKRVYENHNRSVLEHFEERREKLLVLDLEQGLGWHDLCLFLGEPPPSRKFPHENATRLRPYNKLKRRIRQTLKGL